MPATFTGPAERLVIRNSAPLKEAAPAGEVAMESASNLRTSTSPETGVSGTEEEPSARSIWPSERILKSWRQSPFTR